jgi:hypothetical protein
MSRGKLLPLCPHYLHHNLIFRSQNRDKIGGGILASFGSLIRLDAISLGMFPNQQQESAVITKPKKSSSRKKIRKQMIKEREAKIDRYSRPKDQRKRKERRKEDK